MLTSQFCRLKSVKFALSSVSKRNLKVNFINLNNFNSNSFHSSRKVNMGLHDHSLVSLNGKEVPMAAYKGKVVLLENVATL